MTAPEPCGSLHDIVDTVGRLGHRPGLDTLRALAAVAVVLCHAGFYFQASYAAVTVFFVLSGFLITARLLEDQASGGISYWRFYGARARRLLPALVPVVLVALLVNAIWIPKAAGASNVVAALTFQTNIWTISGNPPGALGHLWSLSVEEHFYLMWPLLLTCVRRPLPVCLGLFAASLALAGTTAVGTVAYQGTPSRLGELALGGAAALWWRSGGRMPVPAAVGWALVVVACEVAPGFWVPVGPLLAAPAAVILVMRALHWTRAPLVEVGRRSYGIYLWHLPVIIGLREMGLAPGTAGLLVLGLGLTLCIAWASYRWLEEPWLRPRNVAPLAAPLRELR